MRTTTPFALLLSFALLAGCSRSVLVQVPPRVDLASHGTLGVVQFASNGGPAVAARATRDFQAHIHGAQPGTRLVDLGSREAVLAAVEARDFDQAALRKIGEKYGVDAVFLGEVTYSDPKTRVKISDLTRLAGTASTTVRGDMTCKLVETRTGASVWSSGSWATRRIGRVSVSPERGVVGQADSEDPREAMLAAMLGHLTDDFRPSTVRQRAN
jgi:hypothetical protein